MPGTVELLGDGTPPLTGSMAFSFVGTGKADASGSARLSQAPGVVIDLGHEYRSPSDFDYIGVGIDSTFENVPSVNTVEIQALTQAKEYYESLLSAINFAIKMKSVK